MKTTSKQLQIFVLLIIFCGISISSWNAPFLNEDYTKISENRHLIRTNLLQYTGSTEARIEKSYFRPISNFSLWMMSRIFGDQSAAPYRMLGALCMLVAAFSLGRITQRLTRNEVSSWITVLFFAVHPINSWYYFQGAWIGNTLAITFASAWVMLNLNIVQKNRYTPLHLFISTALFLVAVFSKESIALLGIGFIPYFLFLGVPTRNKLMLISTSLIPTLAYPIVKACNIGILWAKPIVSLKHSFISSGDILTQHFLYWCMGSNFVYGRPVMKYGGLWTGALIALIAVSALIFLFYRKRYLTTWFIWLSIVALIETLIGYSVAPAIICTRLTLFTAIASIAVGFIFHFLMSVPTSDSKVRHNFNGSIKEIFVPTLCLLLAWYAFQSGLHIIKSADVDRFYRYHLKDPKGWRLTFAYADYLQREGRETEAEPFINESVRMYPALVTMNTLGVSRSKKGEHEEALSIFLDILKRDPDNISALNNAGAAYNLLDDRINAAIYFARAFTLDPEYIEVGANLLATYLKASPEERIPMLQVIRNIQRPEIFNQIGINLAKKGDYLDAISHFNIALFQNPGSSRTYSLIAKAYAASGQTEKSIAHFKKSVELNPHNARSFNDWGILEARLGNMEKAREMFARAVELDSRFLEAKQNLSRAERELYSKK